CRCANLRPRSGASTPLLRSLKNWSRSSRIWASRSRKALTSRPMITISASPTFQTIIRRARCTTLFTSIPSRTDLASYCGRIRPSYFPFTEPSLEVDVQCRREKGEIRFGEGEDWLEILGCGMVHPNVLRNCGLDPDEYQGFAWGLGIDRIAMLKYGMPDLRAFFEADVRWLSHYGFRPLDFPTLAGGLSG